MAIWSRVAIEMDVNNHENEYQIDDVFVIEDESQVTIEDNPPPKANHMEMSTLILFYELKCLINNC